MSFLPNQAAAAVMLREAILACYRSGQMSAAQWERHCEDDPELRTILNRQGSISKEGVAAIENADKEPIRWVWSDGSCHDEPESAPRAKTDPIAAMREALKEIDARRYRRLFSNHPWLLSDFGNAYSCGSQQAHEECSDIARAALAAYDAAAGLPRQSADVAATARELAKRASSGDSLAQSRIEGNLLSFAARVAADQRERDAKIAETPDPQLANKTAAQIAAAIRASNDAYPR